MTRANRTADFLQNMTAEIAMEVAPAKPVRTAATRRVTEKAAAPSRAGLKHIGGYLNDETVEKVAALRARLKLDNSQLIMRAVDNLYSKQAAKRAFGDA